MVQGKFPAAIKIGFFLFLGAVILLFPITLPPGAGDGDFQAYWSSAYLFAHGRDFSDPDAIGTIERTLTNWEKSETLYAWFSPIGNVAVLPFTLIPFPVAVYYWLVMNIAILFGSAILIWDDVNRQAWIPLLAVFSFSMTVVSLVFGQINFLEVLGLAIFLSLTRKNRPYLAGAGLVLTTIKPHLVIITLPILFLDLIRKKEWKILIGFFGGLGLCLIVLFAIYPPWMQSFWVVVSSGMNTVRQTPNINGLLVLIGEYTTGKLLWVFALFAAAIWWWKDGKAWDRRTFIDLSVTVGLIVSPIGWSYDQVMLLFPILGMLSWIVRHELTRRTSLVIIYTMVFANLLSYYQRLFVPSDVWFFWVPFIVLGLYLFASNERRSLKRKTSRISAGRSSADKPFTTFQTPSDPLLASTLPVPPF